MTKEKTYTEQLVTLLKKDKWVEPTTDKYPTYLQAYKKHGRGATAPYFEDIHFVWRSRQNNNKIN